jgi:hypothetical protein
MNLYFGAGTNHPVRISTDVRDNMPEDRRYHYKDKRSMAELAKCWLAANGFLPERISKIVGSKELIAGHFEYPTAVWGGGRAMTDMMAFMPDGVIAVEAKVDEPFDDPIAVWIFREEEKNPDSPPRRTGIVQQYARALRVRSEKLLNIRYQLLQRTLCAAKAAKERRVSRAWMVVQAFPGGDQEKCQVNRADFERYLDLVGPAPELDGIRVQLAWVSEIDPG